MRLDGTVDNTAIAAAIAARSRIRTLTAAICSSRFWRMQKASDFRRSGRRERRVRARKARGIR
eukprot:913353-Heterocapsa_arctica.AAC.1